jgi:hypothetical protein
MLLQIYQIVVALQKTNLSLLYVVQLVQHVLLYFSFVKEKEFGIIFVIENILL